MRYFKSNLVPLRKTTTAKEETTGNGIFEKIYKKDANLYENGGKNDYSRVLTRNSYHIRIDTYKMVRTKIK